MHTYVCPECGKVVEVNQKPTSQRLCRSCAGKKRNAELITSKKMGVCQFCGKEFARNSNKQKYCKGPHIRQCPICGKDYIEDNVENLKRPPVACSYECRKARREETSLIKYGIKTPGNNAAARQRSKQTCIERYGHEYSLASPEVRKRCEKTLIANYGVSNPMKNPEIRERALISQRENFDGKLAFNTDKSYQKRRETVLFKYGHEVLADSKIREAAKASLFQKYGVDNPMLSKEIRDRWKKNLLAKYGVDEVFKVPEVREKCKQTMLERYGVANAMHSPELLEKSRQSILSRLNGGRMSKINRKFGELLDENGIQYEYEKYISTNGMTRWYDIHILNTNILIEIDPTYTHNLIGNHWGDGIECGYHLEKTLWAIQNGYRVIHVFDWDDWDKIVNMLRDKKSVYARKCKLYKISTSVANEFLDKYHLQGKCRGQLLCLGLYYNNELVQVMTFGKSRYDKKHDVELLRLCSHPEYRIVGGASKMFKFATAYYGLSNIISYCDVSKFTGEVYEAIGMKKVRTTPPQEVWSDGMSKITANLLRQQGFDRLFGANFGKGANNEILMIEHGWLPIEDCGQYVYEYIG